MNLKPAIAVVIFAIASMLPATAAVAIETPEFTDAVSAYRLAQRQQADLIQEELLADLRLINGPYVGTSDDFGWAVERWRPVVTDYFPEDRIDWALSIIACESHGDPLAKNPTSSASGLFQHLASLWDERSTKAGWAGTDVFDPLANIAVAAWLLDNGGPGHWVCKASL